MSDIHHLLTRALENRGQTFEICWTPAGANFEYILTVQANPRGGDAHWQMIAGLEQKVPLWTYISCDVLLVYNLVVSSSDPGSVSLKTGEHDAAKAGGSPAPAPAAPKTPGLSALQRAMPTNGRATKALAGELCHVQMPTLLQSILMAKMTGTLIIENGELKGEVY
ncbi:MAG TPA: hypothetical protein V6C72_11005, partial [Chroococcales cyanobacterium]